MTTTTGTYRFMAPELLNDECEPITQVTVATDVWAFAMTVIEVRTFIGLLVSSSQPYMDQRSSPNACRFRT